MTFRLGGHAVAAGNLANLHAAIIRRIFGNQLVEQLAQNAAYLAVAQLEGARLLSLDAALVAATTSGPHRSGEERAVYGEHAARPDWRAHGRYLAELRSAAMAPVAGASQ